MGLERLEPQALSSRQVTKLLINYNQSGWSEKF